MKCDSAVKEFCSACCNPTTACKFNVKLGIVIAMTQHFQMIAALRNPSQTTIIRPQIFYEFQKISPQGQC
jgi:hypothetical protein